MGWMWFIPCFHLPQPPPAVGSEPAPTTKILISRSEVDFPLGFGALLVDVEIEFGWSVEEDEVAETVSPSQADEAEPVGAALLAAAGGNLAPLQGVKD